MRSVEHLFSLYYIEIWLEVNQASFVLILWLCSRLSKARVYGKRKTAFGEERIWDAIVGRF